MTELQEQIRLAVAGGLSHRKTAAKFKVSIREVQKAIDPQRRAELDRQWHALAPLRRALAHAKG